MKRTSLNGLVACALAVALSGCNEPNGLYPVYGKVLYRGEPAVGAAVFFHKIGGPPSDVVPTGVVDEEGNFRLSCDAANGAPPGMYNVLIAWQDRSAATNPAPEPARPAAGKGSRKSDRTASKIRPSPSLPSDRLKGRYSDADHPRLKAEIKPESNSLAAFELTD